MKRLFCLWLIFLLTATVVAQSSKYSADEIVTFFNQIREATESHTTLWDKDIYGPVLLVDPQTREAFANVQDANKELTDRKSVV